jgi:hypothetical protein
VKTRRKAALRQGRRRSPRHKKTEKGSPSRAGANVWVSIHVIRGSRTRHGPRAKWGRLQYAQAAIAALYPLGLPDPINQSQLVKDVNAKLESDPRYRETRFGELPRTTVLRAAKTLLDANPGSSVLQAVKTPPASNAG